MRAMLALSLLAVLTLACGGAWPHPELQGGQATLIGSSTEALVLSCAERCTQAAQEGRFAVRDQGWSWRHLPAGAPGHEVEVLGWLVREGEVLEAREAPEGTLTWRIVEAPVSQEPVLSAPPWEQARVVPAAEALAEGLRCEAGGERYTLHPDGRADCVWRGDGPVESTGRWTLDEGTLAFEPDEEGCARLRCEGARWWTRGEARWLLCGDRALACSGPEHRQAPWVLLLDGGAGPEATARAGRILAAAVPLVVPDEAPSPGAGVLVEDHDLLIDGRSTEAVAEEVLTLLERDLPSDTVTLSSAGHAHPAAPLVVTMGR
ncbi:MAG: hypothetical protein JXX28_12800 [Deltaproteobacteria bacterium]|nr:hypothetical protein [Deltaproteobacteria bacterium]